jgi:hypothetical protein
LSKTLNGKSILKNSKISWKFVAELIGMTAIGLSLVFVGLQLRQSQVIAENEVGLQELANRIEAHGQINEHINVWSRGLAGEELSDKDAAVFENLLVNINDITFHAASNYFSLGDETSARWLIGDLAIFLHENTGARSAWEARELRLAKGRQIAFSNYSLESPHFPYVEWVIEALENLDKGAN